MGDILKKITELLENGGNYEQSRSTGIIINSNWFDAVYQEDDRRGAASQNKGVLRNVESIKKRELTKKSTLAINYIP